MAPLEIEVVDRTHPLFGQCFRLISQAGPGGRQAKMQVASDFGCVLNLARSATNLEPLADWSVTPTRLSVEALRDLLTVAGEAVAPCRSSPARSGTGSRRNSARRSPATSPRPCGR